MEKACQASQSAENSHAQELLLSSIMDMGELLLTSGAEILRVEDTLSRLCRAYGFCRVDVFTITSSIVLTVHHADGRVFTQTRRIVSRNTDLAQVARVNALSRQLCAAPLPAQQVQQRLQEIRQKKGVPAWLQLLMYGALSSIFSIFFGGTVFDGVAAWISGLFMYASLSFAQRLHLNSILQSALVSAFTGLVAIGLVRLGIGSSPQSIIIGNIMLLIPGVAFTTSLRDLINGDTISGLLGLVEAVVKAMAIAMGFAGVLLLVGG